MTGRLLLQLAMVASRDADALEDCYAWPRKALSAEEERELARLRAVAQRLHYRAAAQGWGSAGSDAAFGPEEESTRP